MIMGANHAGRFHLRAARKPLRGDPFHHFVKDNLGFKTCVRYANERPSSAPARESETWSQTEGHDIMEQVSPSPR